MYRKKTRTKIINLIIVPLILLSLVSCTNEQTTTIHKRKFISFGTYIEIVIAGVPEAKANQAFDKIENEFEYMARTWWPWRKGALRRINSLLPSGEWFSGAPSVHPLLLRAQTLSIKSNHLFNPAIGRLVELWGFHNMRERNKKPPDPQAIRKLVLANPRLTDIEFNGIRMRGKNPAIFIDLGAIAKGYAIERVVEMLRGQGIYNAIINTGGDLKTIGSKGSQPWKIAIRDPLKQSRVFASLLTQGNEAVFTSGDYERFFNYKGERFHHIIDPRTGYPAKGFRSVTVVHHDATLADAAATALFVAGPEHWQAIAKKMNVTKTLLIKHDNTVYISQKLVDRINFRQKNSIKIIPVSLE